MQNAPVAKCFPRPGSEKIISAATREVRAARESETKVSRRANHLQDGDENPGGSLLFLLNAAGRATVEADQDRGVVHGHHAQTARCEKRLQRTGPRFKARFESRGSDLQSRSIEPYIIIPMRSARHTIMAQMGIGVIGLLVLDAVFAPRSASAGCGHLVTSRSDSLMNPVLLDALIVSGNSASGTEAPLGQPAPGRQNSCSGMSCSSRDPLPASTTSPGSNGFDQWGVLHVLAISHTDFPSFLAVGVPSPSFTGEKSSIFHPPRV